MIQYSDSADEDESEEDTSIPSSENGTVAVEGEDGQRYVVLEVVQLDDEDQLENYSSSTVSLQQANQSCKYKSHFFFVFFYRLFNHFNIFFIKHQIKRTLQF